MSWEEVNTIAADYFRQLQSLKPFFLRHFLAFGILKRFIQSTAVKYIHKMKEMDDLTELKAQ